MQSSLVALPTATAHTFATRDEWLAARQSFGIGSSDVPAILGISRFQSALALYHEKLGLTKPTTAYLEQARWGQILEDPISQRYAEETHRGLLNPNAEGKWTILRNTERPHMIASVDRLIVDTTVSLIPVPAFGVGVLECKNAHLMMKDEWLGPHNNEPPVEYQVQLQHQLAVSGLTWGSIAALIGGSMFVWADVPRDEALIAKLIEVEAEFMERLATRNPPKADGSESARETLKALYPKDTGATVTLPLEASEWHYELQGAKEARLAAEKLEADYSNKLKQAIGDATCGVLQDGTTYTFKAQKREEFVSPACEFRVLRLVGGGKKKAAK